jgi:hypothetical protein
MPDEHQEFRRFSLAAIQGLDRIEQCFPHAARMRRGMFLTAGQRAADPFRAW